MTADKNFYEVFAVKTLEYYFPDKFRNLEKTEKPDFLNDYIGLEVTRAVNNSEAELYAAFNKYKNCQLKCIPKKLLKKFGFTNDPVPANDNIFLLQISKKNGILKYVFSRKEDDFVLFSMSSKMEEGSFSCDNVKKSVLDKLEKLNNNYMLRNENDLAIIIEEQASVSFYIGFLDDELKECIDGIKSIFYSHKFTNYFNNIYFIFLDAIVIIETKDWKYECKVVTNETHDSLLKATRDFIKSGKSEGSANNRQVE